MANMTNKKYQQDEVEQSNVPVDSTSVTQQLNESRRNFTKAGLAASGVLMTLASRPVMGEVVSKSPSGFLSGNQSSHGTPCISQGRSPGFWKMHTGGWPVSTDTRFSTVFSCSHSSVYRKYTLMQLLNHQKDDVNNLGMHLVAAFLNARKGWTPFLEEERIRTMYTEWQTKGSFSPVANVSWNAIEIVNYLKATQS